MMNNYKKELESENPGKTAMIWFMIIVSMMLAVAVCWIIIHFIMKFW